MAKRNDPLKITDQIIKRMDEHNLAEAKVGNIHLKKENPQVVADREQSKEIDEKRRQIADRIPDWLWFEVASENWTPDDELVKVNDQVMRRRQYNALQDAQNPPK